jgi:hypothetical protein
MYIVNAPWTFRAVFSIVKGFLDAKTVAKIEIVGGSYQSTLLKEIEAENLPTFLGGKCTCADSTGDCKTSDAGPWTNFELTNPDNRFVKKGEA